MFVILKQISLIDLNFYNLTLLLRYCFFDGLLIKSRGLSTSATPMTRTQVTDRQSIYQTF